MSFARTLRALAIAAAFPIAASQADVTPTLLHTFDMTHGSFPNGLALNVQGTLYGTTSQGGPDNDGVLFSVTGTQFKVLHEFGHGSGGGIFPDSEPLLTSNGTLYGTLSEGGKNGEGTIYSWDAANGYRQVVSFGANAAVGTTPFAGLTQAADGTLYGVTAWGGDPTCNCGAVFAFDPSKDKFSALHTFIDKDGGRAKATLTLDGATLHGATTLYKGTGRGSPFDVGIDGSAFDATKVIGVGRNFAGQVRDANGVWWGFASEAKDTEGQIYRIGADGVYSVAYTFPEVVGAAMVPVGAPLIGADGLLYGMTLAGGTSDLGTIFSYDTAGGTLTVLYSFDGTLGSNPQSGLVQDASGMMYGTTQGGDLKHFYGTVFSFHP